MFGMSTETTGVSTVPVEYERIIREFQDRGIIWLLESAANLRELVRLLARELAEQLDFTRATPINRSLIPDDIHQREAAEQKALFDALRQAVPQSFREEVEEMIMSSAQAWKAEGQAEGLAKGRAEGRVEAFMELLECRFGSVPEQLIAAVKVLPPERLKELTKQVITAQSLADLHLE